MRLGGPITRTFVAACGSLIAVRTGTAQFLEVTPRVLMEFIGTADSANVAGIQQVGLGVVGADKLAFKVVVLGNPNFVVVSPASGMAPALVSIGLNPNVVPYLRSGNHSLSVQFAAPGQSCPPCVGISVDLRLVARPPPSIGAVVNAASLRPAIAPGAVVSIFGANVGTPPISARFDEGGLYPTTLGNTTVTFNCISAALLYVSTTQINALVPYGLAGQRAAEVVVTHNAARSPPFSAPVLDTSPGIFTATQSGSGQGAILNNGLTFNSVDNPAPKGSVIVMFGTGPGLWNQEFPDGSIFLAPVFPAVTPAAPVSLTIGGQPARIQYAGPSLYQVSGLIQVNAVVPEGIDSGPQPVVLTIGQNSNAEQRVTVAVQ